MHVEMLPCFEDSCDYLKSFMPDDLFKCVRMKAYVSTYLAFRDFNVSVEFRINLCHNLNVAEPEIT